MSDNHLPLIWQYFKHIAAFVFIFRMSRSVGVHVFPTQISERIRSSPKLIHYEIPTEEQQLPNRSSVPRTGLCAFCLSQKHLQINLSASHHIPLFCTVVYKHFMVQLLVISKKSQIVLSFFFFFFFFFCKFRKQLKNFY